MDSSKGMGEMTKWNRHNILFGLIRTRGRASKYDLQKESRFSMSSVISSIDELLTKGYIHQSGIGCSTGGRRPVYYSVNPEGGYFLGVEFNAESIHAALLNLKCEPVRQYREVIRPGASVESAVERVLQAAQFLANSLEPCQREKLLGIGIGAPGLVDPERGEILYYAHFPECRNIPIRERFETLFSVPVFVENNINAMATAYRMLPEFESPDSFALISIRSGVRMSCVLGHRLYRGATGTAGEIGHIRVYPSEAFCRCGRQGCLESEVSNPAILQKLNEGRTGRFADLAKSVGKPFTPEDLPRFTKAAAAGHPGCLALLDEISGYLAQVIVPIVDILNPSRIILSGELAQCGTALLYRLQKQVQADSFSPNANRLELTLSPTGPELGAVGAAAYALSELFEPIDVAELAHSSCPAE